MEDSKEYAWKRFWAPRDDNVHLHLEDGFLPNPKEPYSHIRNLSVISFESIDKIPCLILLGEPGIGKSIWMEREIRNRKKAAIQNNSIVLHFNLNTITESNLVDKIFNNIEFKKWENSDSYLELFIDSFDEGRLRVNHIADILLEEFMSISLEIQRLKLRITCRGADWPDYFENNFESLWAIPYMNKSLEPKLGEINEIKDNTEKLDEFHDTDISSSSDISLEDNKGGEKKTDKHKLAVYSMMPLRLEDIKIALLSEKINKNEFLEELERCDAFSLASHPDTFKMLINLYREHGGKLPDNKVEIHNEGLLLKCEETNISRKASGDIGKYEPEVRRDIASFIASMTLLSNRQNISFDRVSSINASSDIYARLMIAELNFSNSSIQIVDSNNINDTIKYSKLFTPSGTNCFRFNQRTHWEFLTARFLNLSNLSLEQRLKLLTNRVDDQIKIVPQLAEVASWLASMDRDFFNILLELEPKIILRSDVGTIKRNRYQLLKKLLEEFANGNLTDPDYSLRHHYKKLNCEGIGNLLAKYLEDITQGIEVRLQAIFIADACKVVDIQELLATIVFDKDQHKYLRERSATVLSRIGDTKTRGKLKPLLADTEEEELKGYLLMSLWDDHVNIEEVLTCVTLKKQSEVNIENEYPSNSVIGGGFDIFFRFDFLQKVKIDDFPILLEWIDDVVDVYWVTSTIETLISDAYKMIIKNARKIIIRKALIKSIIHRIDTHKDPIPTDSIDKYPIPYFENDEDRRTILKDMIAYFSTDQKNKYNYRWFSLERSPLCDPEDAEWIIEQIKCVKEISIRETWSKLLFHVFINKKMSGKQISKILEAIEEFKELKEQFKNHIGVKEINSKEAIEWRKHNSITPKYTKKKLDPQALVISELKQLEDGEIGIWWHINKLMTLIPDSNYYGDFTNPDLTSLPVWINADSKLRKRILNAAKKYLEKANNNVENWVGTNKFNRNDLAAYRAIRL
ncbi:MAG: HEAT repeat domain-containing protein, partial [Candidatus Electryonea clarkiae]|nr:HEAT repeat domain-containing protein [Candidatus Electryonea clarkiae]